MIGRVMRREWGAATFVITVLVGALAVAISLLLRGGAATPPPPIPCPTYTPYPTYTPLPSGYKPTPTPTVTPLPATPAPSINPLFANCPTAPLPPVPPTVPPTPTRRRRSLASVWKIRRGRPALRTRGGAAGCRSRG